MCLNTATCSVSHAIIRDVHVWSPDLGVPLQTFPYLSLAVYVVRGPLSRIMHPQRRDTVSIIILLLGGSERQAIKILQRKNVVLVILRSLLGDTSTKRMHDTHTNLYLL